MNFRVFDSKDDLARALADAVRDIILAKERSAIALSGGTSPKALYTLLGRPLYREALSVRDVIWITGDERCVPPDDAASNAKMIRETLFAEGISARHRFVPFRTEDGTPEEIAVRFESEWRAAGIAQLDLAILGAGDDGHTASLFPDTGVIEVGDRIAAAVYVPRLDSWRVTVTLPELRRAAAKYVIATGEGKRGMIDRARAGEPYPIVLVTAGEGESWWFVDRAAYGEGDRERME